MRLEEEVMVILLWFMSFGAKRRGSLSRGGGEERAERGERGGCGETRTESWQSSRFA